jgi:hypothetical protein
MQIEKCLKGMKKKRCREEAWTLSKMLAKLWLKQLTNQAKHQLLQRATKHSWIEKCEKDRSLSNCRCWSKRKASTHTNDTHAQQKEKIVEEGEELA